jgi:hypothetical protein
LGIHRGGEDATTLVLAVSFNIHKSLKASIYNIIWFWFLIVTIYFWLFCWSGCLQVLEVVFHISSSWIETKSAS